jgi:hypothetical protein
MDWVEPLRLFHPARFFLSFVPLRLCASSPFSF